MKRIAFLIIDNDIDGRGPTHIKAAFWKEEDRNAAHEAMGNNKNYYRCEDRIVDDKLYEKTLLARLDGLDKLILGIEQFKK